MADARDDSAPSDPSEAPPSAWIRTIEPLEATGDVGAAYHDFFDPKTGAMDNIMKVHGLLPRSLQPHYDLYRSAMDSTPSLHRAEREMVAVAVSGINGCHY